MPDSLTTLQTDVAARLAGDAYFTGPPAIEVLTEARVELEAEAARQLESLGIAAVVLTPVIRRGSMPRAIEAEVEISVAENVLYNRASTGTEKPAAAVVLAAFNRLLDWAPPNNWTRCLPGEIRLEEAGGLLIYTLTTRTQLVLPV